MHRVRHARCTRRSGYPDRGYTLTTRYMPICTESDTQDAPDVVATPVGVSLSSLAMYDMHRVRHARCTRRSGYPDRGYTSVTAGERSRQASVTRGYRTTPTNYPEAGSTSTHIRTWYMSVWQYSRCATPVGVGVSICYHAGGGTRFARLPPVIEIIPRSGYRSRAKRKKATEPKPDDLSEL